MTTGQIVGVVCVLAACLLYVFRYEIALWLATLRAKNERRQRNRERKIGRQINKIISGDGSYSMPWGGKRGGI